MSLEIEAGLEKYVRLTEDGKRIETFVCPVDGCDFTTKLGAGALRMHIILNADPEKKGRYDQAHETFYGEHTDELSLGKVQYLHKRPRVEIES